MRKTFALAGALTMAALLAVTGASAHEARFKSHLTLKERVSAKAKRGTFKYAGRITSEKDQCEPGRLITLYGKEPGEEAAEFGVTETDADGRYQFIQQVNPPLKYFTKASKGSFGGSGHDHICLDDKSNAIDYTIPETARARKGASFETTVKIANYIMDMGSNSFLGKVRSENPNCKPDRKGKIFRKRPGDDELVGKDRTTPQGFFSVPHEPPSAGAYYAKVGKVEIPAGICKGDRSPIFELN